MLQKRSSQISQVSSQYNDLSAGVNQRQSINMSLNTPMTMSMASQQNPGYHAGLNQGFNSGMNQGLTMSQSINSEMKDSSIPLGLGNS